jgi:hypothetical protein
MSDLWGCVIPTQCVKWFANFWFIMNIEQYNVLNIKVITNYGGSFLDKLGVHLDQVLTLKIKLISPSYHHIWRT